MKISIPVKVTLTENMEIPVPSFWENKSNPAEVVAFFDEKTVLKIYQSENYCSLLKSEPAYLTAAFSTENFQQISEERFMTLQDIAFDFLKSKRPAVRV